MTSYRPQKLTRKSVRARELIASIYHIPLKELRGDRNAVVKMYDDLEHLGFEWVADEQEWLNPTAKDPKHAQVMSFVVGSATHSIEVAGAELIRGLEALGYKVVNAEITIMVGDEQNSIARIEVTK